METSKYGQVTYLVEADRESCYEAALDAWQDACRGAASDNLTEKV